MPVSGPIFINDASDKTITGQITYDRANGGTFVLGAGTTFPTPAQPGELFWRTDESKLYRRNDGDTAWEPEGLDADVVAALAGTFGTPSATNRFVTETDPYYLAPDQVIRVSHDGHGDFASVATALASITDATTTKRYTVQIAPGQYTEPPFTVPSFVCLVGSNIYGGTRLITNTNSAHFITVGADTALENLDLVGPTGVGFAAVNHSVAGVAMLRRVIIRAGYYGVWAHGASAPNKSYVHCWDVIGRATVSGSIHTLFRCTDYGHLQTDACGPMTGSGYSFGFFIDGANASGVLTACFGLIPGGTLVYVDNLASLRGNATSFTLGSTGVWAGPAGAFVDIAAGQFRPGGFTTEIRIDSASLGSFAFQGFAKRDTFNIASGANIQFNFLDDQSTIKGVYIWNDAVFGNPGYETPMSGVLEAIKETGLLSGGALTASGGLNVDVAAGVGFFSTVSGLIRKSWTATTIALPANEDYVYIAVNSAGVVSASTTPIDYRVDVLLGVASTVAADIVALATESVLIPFSRSTLHEYFEEIIGPKYEAGCGSALVGAPPTLQFSVDAGTYFTADNLVVAAASASPCEFTTWYRDGTGGWVKTPAQTTLDDENYDNGSGTLAAIPSGQYVRHKAFITSTNGVSQWHVVYGQQTFATVVAATSDPAVLPEILKDHGLGTAAFVILKSGNTVASLVDTRPTLAGGASGSGGGVTDHGALTGLSDDDHLQYQLRTEKGAANGYAGLNASAKIANANLDTATSPPPAVAVSAGTAGVGPKLAFEDHTHSLSVGPISGLTVGGPTSNGTATSAAASDHLHALPPFGSTAGTFAEGNDARLSDSRTPTGAASGDLTGTYPSPTIAALAVTDAKVAAANKDGLATTPSLRTLGTGAQQAAAGNDPRLSDSRAPNGPASGDLTGTYPAPTIAALAVTDAKVAAANKDGLAATPSLRTLGIGAQQAAAGNDPRLSDDRVASGLRSASTVVSVSGATAPTAGQVLTATGASAATWQTPAATSSVLVKTASAEVTANTTSTSTAFVDLLTVNITTGAGFLCIFAAGAVSNTNANVNMRLRVLLDGVSIGGVQLRTGATNIAMGFSFNRRIAVTAGARVVKLQWATANNTMQCRPVANPDAESASLLVQEVTA